MKKFFCIFFFLLFSLFFIKPQTFYFSSTQLRLYINMGVSYNFPLTTDYLSQTESFFIDLPLGICLDIRTNQWYSFYTGMEFLYGLHTQKATVNHRNNDYYLHNFFIRIPFIIRFYPLADRESSYENFYIGVGAVLHFWPVNCYYIVVNRGEETHSGNAYNPGLYDDMPPGNIYTPANIGTRISIGNSFELNSKVLMGIELYVNYLFIPYVNGYYFNQNYNRGYAVIVDFNASIGIFLSFGINLM